MSTITASAVNELRQKTGAGLMDCKKALEASNGDLEGAIDYLRKKGQKVSALRAGKEAKEGLAIAKTDGKTGIVIHLTSETDFVAKNQEFVDFANAIADKALNEKPATLESLLTLQLDSLTIAEKVTELVGKINERIELARYEILTGETVVAYNHGANRIGVLVALNQSQNDKINEVGRDVAMQIAALNPVAIDQNGVSQDIIQREMEIAKEQTLAEGKPENMVEKIAQGKLQKFFKENTLLPQPFVKDTSKSVQQVLTEAGKDLTVTGFFRVALG